MEIYRGLTVSRTLKLIKSRLHGSFFKATNKNIRAGKRLKLTGGIRISQMFKSAQLKLGDSVQLYAKTGFFLDSPVAVIEIGNHTFLNRRTEIVARKHVKIGEWCAISWDVTIMDTDSHTINGSSESKPVIIGNHVLIGCKSTILKGVTIGDGAIIGAGSLVTSNVPPRTMVAGVPAKVIKHNVEWS